MLERFILSFLAIWICLLQPSQTFGQAGPKPGLTLGTGVTVLKEGKPYRGIGVNYFDCFLRTLQHEGDESYKVGFATLARHRIPFARFAASGYWPSEMSLYTTNREAYFRRLDGVVKAAEESGVGLIPSLFWYLACVPDLVSEPMSAWGDPKSRTQAFARQYTREVVGRYAKSPAIWAWEMGNEYNLAADLPNAPEHRPPIVKELGTAPTRSPKDDVTHDMLSTAMATFADEVRKLDPHRLITTGDAIPRTTAWHNRAEKSWAKDSPEQFRKMLGITAPPGVDLLSVHCYGGDLQRLAECVAASRALKKPLFLGEFQVPKSAPAQERTEFEALLRTVDETRVPLAAVWVFDYREQEAEFNVTATNGREWQLELLREWNDRVSKSP